MVGTIVIHGSDGKVMAPIEGEEFIEGQWQNIRIIAASNDEDLPLHIRQALVGLIIPTIFSRESDQIAYASGVVEALKAANKTAIADDLLAVLKEFDPEGEYHFVVFKAGEYQLLE